MHIDVILSVNDQKNKTVVLSFAGGQAESHIAQEMDRAVGRNTNLVLWQDQNHRLSDRIVIQAIQDTVHSVDCLLRGIELPANRPMGLQSIV